MVESSPPPLPPALSSRLSSSIDPKTGMCKHHPTVQLCELIQNNTRWVVRRKICYKCGSRPGAAGGKHHRPGKCVSHVSRESKLIGEETTGTTSAERGRQRSRSSSAMRGNSRSSRSLMRSSSLSNDRHPTAATGSGSNGRGRSLSTTRRSRSVSVGASGRERLNASNRNMSVSRERGLPASAVELKKEDGDKLKSSNIQHTKSMTTIDRNEKVKKNSKTDANKSYRNRALEFTQKAMEVTEDEKGPSQAIVPVERTKQVVHDSAAEESNDFDESDPIIMIPTIHLDDTSLPPPPPRSSEEMEIHEHRMELRRQHIRRQRRESSSSRRNSDANAHSQETTEKKSRSPRRSSSLKQTSNEGAVSKEVRKNRRDENKVASSKPRKRPDSPTPVSAAPVHPSLAVLTALENHRKKVDDKKHEPTNAVDQQRRGRSKDKKDKVDDGLCKNTEEDGESETSSISTASAKRYQMQPGTTSGMRSRSTPPVNVTVDRSKSRSKSRPRIRAIDAPEEKEVQLTVYDKTSSQRLSSARGSGSGVKKRSSKVEKESTHDEDAAENDKKKITKHSKGKQQPKRSHSSRSVPRENSTKVHPEKQTSSSSARVSHRSSRSLSGGLWDADGNKIAEKRTSKSVERSSSAAKSSRRCKSSEKSRTSRSRHTSNTHPESLSSDNLLRKSNTKDVEPAVVYKKRAKRRSRKEERRQTVDSSEDIKPMTAISYSEDERSHASSISAGSTSTIEESFGSHDEDAKGDKPPADVREKAISVLNDVKGGAKHFAVKGKNAFGGLKGTSKKWQSAIFM